MISTSVIGVLGVMLLAMLLKSKYFTFNVTVIPCQPFGPENLSPFFKRQLGGYNKALVFIGSAYNIEKKLGDQSGHLAVRA
jgi:hypothetical protein